MRSRLTMRSTSAPAASAAAADTRTACSELDPGRVEPPMQSTRGRAGLVIVVLLGGAGCGVREPYGSAPARPHGLGGRTAGPCCDVQVVQVVQVVRGCLGQPARLATKAAMSKSSSQ